MQGVYGISLPEDEMQPYQPLWLASVTNPTVGDGVLTGMWVRTGRLVFVSIGLKLGATSNIGNGTYTWTLPFNAARWPYPGGTASQMGYSGAAWAIKSLVAFYTGTARVSAGSNLLSVVNHLGGNTWSNTIPVAFAANSILAFTIVYPTDVKV